MKKIKKKERSAIKRALFFFGVLFLLGILSFSVLSAVLVDEEYDDALFDAVGEDSATRFFYNGEEGERVAELEGYRAIEWESERIKSGAECLYVPIEEIPENLQNAFVAIEDIRFYRHNGVDFLRTGKAALNTVFRFSSRFGGSTITQQLIKNIGGEKDITVVRKGKEMLRALSLEKRHSKREILEAYLNIVPMSQNRIGVGAGAMLYFGKTPKELTLAECAGIAAVTRAPAVYAPERNKEKYLERRNTVLAVMRREGMITEEEYETAVKEDVKIIARENKTEGVRSWYIEQVIEDVTHALCEKGYTKSAAKALLYRGGLKIYTAVDMRAQRLAEEYFENEANFLEYGDGFAASFVLLSPKNGDLAALVGNVGEKKGNLLLNHASKSLHAPGSALKPVALYAPAVEEGLINEADVFDDVPVEFRSDGSYWPRNADGCFCGLIGTAEALAKSKNTVAVSLYQKLGAEHIYASLLKSGIDSLVRQKVSVGGEKLSDLGASSLALGELTDGVTLLSLSRAYLPFADGGNMHTVRSFYLVADKAGKTLLHQSATSERIYSESTASVMTHMLKQVVEEGSASALTIAQTIDTAGKTGTSSGSRNRFFVGYTPYFLAGVWCGYEDGTSAVGGNIHLNAFDGVMCKIHEGIPANENAPTFTMAKGLRAVKVCADSGLLCSPICALDPRGERTRTVWLREEELPHAYCDVHKAYRYSEKCGGVLLGGDPKMSDEKKISLVRVENRDFPVNIFVADAEYTCRELGATPPAEGDCAFYASLLEEGRFAGAPPHGKRPYNAWAKIEGDEKEQKSEPSPIPPLPRFPQIPTPKAKPSENPLRRFFENFRKRRA